MHPARLPVLRLPSVLALLAFAVALHPPAGGPRATARPPETVWDGVSPTGLAANATHLFVATAGNSLETCSLSPTESNPVLARISFDLAHFDVLLERCYGYIRWLYADATHLYYLDSDNYVKRMPVAGGTAQMVVFEEQVTAGVATDGTHIYWSVTGNPNDTLKRKPLDGSGAPETLAAVPNGSHIIRNMAVDATHIYWTDWAIGAGKVRRMPKAGGGIQTLADEADGVLDPSSLAIDDTHVYFGDHGTGSLRRVPKVGGAVFNFITDPPPYYYVSAIDMVGGNLFWADGTGGYDARVRKLPKSSGATTDAKVTDFAILELGVSAVLATSTHVYWGQSGAVMRQEIDGDGVAVDLTVKELEVTQGIQCLPGGGTFGNVPLVEDKVTYVRVYPDVGFFLSGHANIHQDNVTMVLHGLRGGVEVDGSPIAPLADGLRVRHDDPLVREDWFRTFNFKLPKAWRTGDIRLQAEINPGQALPETNYSNNTATRDCHFSNPDPLCPVLVPVDLQGPYDAQVSDDEMFETIDLLKVLWPSARMHFGSYGTIHEGSDWYEIPDDGAKILDKLEWIDFWAVYPSGWCESGQGRTHYVGVLDPPFGYSGTVGLGRLRDNVCWFMKYMGQSESINPAQLDYYEDAYGTIVVRPGIPFGAQIMAHELAHNFQRDHIDCGGPDDPDTNYPYATDRFNDESARGYWGLDTRRVGATVYENWTVISPLARSSDLMSYCRPAWISDYTYRNVLARHGGDGGGGEVQGEGGGQGGADLPLDPTGEVLVVSAVVARDGGSSELDRVQVVPGKLLGKSKLQALDAKRRVLMAEGTSLRLELEGLRGAVLAGYDFQPLRPTDASASSSFLIAVQHDAAALRIVLKSAGQEVAARAVSRRLPSVTVTSPNGGESYTAGFKVTWDSSDPDGDGLLHDVHYSHDGGMSWRAVALEVKGTSVDIESPEKLPGSEALSLVRVLASDGVLSDTDVSDRPFSLAYRPPIAHIDSPRDGELIAEGHAVVLRGGALDAEDGEVEESGLLWTVDGAQVGTGSEAEVAGLSIGKHHAMLIAIDQQNLTGVDNADFYVIRRFCPLATPLIDIAFVVESSSIMFPEQAEVCARIKAVTGLLEELGLAVKYDIRAVQGSTSCAPDDAKDLDPATLVTSDTHWHHATRSVEYHKVWQDGALRLIVPVVKQPPLGVPTGESDPLREFLLPAVVGALENGVSVVPWILPLGAEPLALTRRVAEELAQATGGEVAEWTWSDLEVALALREVKARNGCRPDPRGVVPPEAPPGDLPRTVFGDHLRPGIRIEVGGAEARDVEVAPDGTWATFRLPRKVGPGAELDLSIERPGGGTVVLPGAVRTTPAVSTAVNRRARAIRFLEGRGIEVSWSVAIHAAPPAVVDFSSEVLVEINGQNLRVLDERGSFPAGDGGCAGAGCDGGCPLDFQCQSEPWPHGCACGKLFSAAIPHDLKAGDRVRLEVSAARGAEVDAVAGDDELTEVYGAPGTRFVRGDCNSDGDGDLTDVVFLLSFNFLGGQSPGCFAACDADGDGQVAGVVTDAIYLIQFQFLGGSRPAPPYPACGVVPAGEPDAGCRSHPPCE